MNRIKIGLVFLAATLCMATSSWSEGAGGTSGLVLLRDSGARSSALGEAFVSMSDDITAMDFNPASLATLKTGQASLQYDRGAFQDSFSKAMLGMGVRPNSAFGLSLGYYNSGKTTLFDGINNPQSVIAEQDRLASIGYAFQKNAYALGASVNYLWSDLAEANSASAVSADVGLQYQIAPRFRFGVSGPLIQSNLQYANTAEKLPRLYRTGIGWNGFLPLATGHQPLQLLFDVPYEANEQKTALALGAETQFGVLNLRLGWNTQSDIQQFSVGAGLHFSQMDLDYSFGMVDQSNISALQKVTLSLRFNDIRNHAEAYSSATPAPSGHEVETQGWSLKANQNAAPPLDNSEKLNLPPPSSSDKITYSIYEIKDGETLESIALHRYGSADRWSDIYEANRYMYSSPDQMKPGSRILLPVSVKKGS